MAKPRTVPPRGAGSVGTPPCRLARERLASLLDPDPADPWPRHHQHFCARLAVTAHAYRQVGGVPEVRHLEDEALVAALRREDFAVRHSPLVRVLTPGRLLGRVEVGLAWQLRERRDQANAAPSLMVEVAQAHADATAYAAALAGPAEVAL